MLRPNTDLHEAKQHWLESQPLTEILPEEDVNEILLWLETKPETAQRLLTHCIDTAWQQEIAQ